MPTHGRVELFNFETFDESPKRLDSDKDVNDLCECIKKFNVKSRVTKNRSSLKSCELKKKLDAVAKSFNSDIKYTYFLSFFSSHGDGLGILTRDDVYYPLSDIIGQFSDERCPSLVGIPKIFIVQACRGCECDRGHKVQPANVPPSPKGCDTHDSTGIEALPIRGLGLDLELQKKLSAIESCGSSVTTSLRALHEMMPADCVLAFSTPPERYSWRSESKGGYYAQTLIKTMKHFKKSGLRMDIEKILQATNQTLATQFSSNATGAVGMKQIGEFVSTLTRRALLEEDTSN